MRVEFEPSRVQWGMEWRVGDRIRDSDRWRLIEQAGMAYKVVGGRHRGAERTQQVVVIVYRADGNGCYVLVIVTEVL